MLYLYFYLYKMSIPIIISIIVVVIVIIVVAVIVYLKNKKHDKTYKFKFLDSKNTELVSFSIPLSLTNSEHSEITNGISEAVKSAELTESENEYLYNIKSTDDINHALNLNNMISYLNEEVKINNVNMSDGSQKSIKDLYIKSVAKAATIAKSSENVENAIKTSSTSSSDINSSTKSDSSTSSKVENESSQTVKDEDDKDDEDDEKDDKNKKEDTKDEENKSEADKNKPDGIEFNFIIQDKPDEEAIISRYIILDNLEDYHNKISDILTNYKGNLVDDFKQVDGYYLYTLSFANQDALEKALTDIGEKIESIMIGFVIESPTQKQNYQFVDSVKTKAYMKNIEDKQIKGEDLIIGDGKDETLFVEGYKVYKVTEEQYKELIDTLRKA